MNKQDITSLSAEAISLLQRLVAIPSFSKEEQGTASLLYSFLQSKGVKAQRYINNVWAKNLYYDDAKPTLLLNSHHDTVKPNAAYTKHPFTATVEEGVLYGLGSNDAGGSLVALLAVFLHFYGDKNLRYNLVFAATAEEEISGSNGIEALLPLLGDIDAAIVGEPTGMNMAVAEKGLLVLDCIVTGVAGHAARDEGVNAIYKAMQDVQWFQSYGFPEVSPLLGPVKMTVTMINAGAQHNIVPAKCDFTVDIRVNDCYTHQQIIDEVKKYVGCDIVPRSLRLRPTSIDVHHPLVQAGLHLGLKTFGSSTLSDKALMSFPALKLGPGESARSHTADEFIFLHEIEEAVHIYTDILKQLL
jgi:acetylornithine deacetylase